MSSRISTLNGSERSSPPGQAHDPEVKIKSEESKAIAGNWNSGIKEDSDISDPSDSQNENYLSGFSETENSSETSSSSSSSSNSDSQAANSAVKKMRSSNSQIDQAEENTTKSHQHPSKFCLTGVGTSLGFSAAVAGFAATTFLYDLMTRFPDKATTEIGVAFGASVVIALGGTITCSTSMVFMIRELCKTAPG
jgi:hypothetical protein